LIYLTRIIAKAWRIEGWRIDTDLAPACAMTPTFTAPARDLMHREG
jgi:hypothetical protein